VRLSFASSTPAQSPAPVRCGVPRLRLNISACRLVTPSPVATSALVPLVCGGRILGLTLLTTSEEICPQGTKPQVKFKGGEHMEQAIVLLSQYRDDAPCHVWPEGNQTPIQATMQKRQAGAIHRHTLHAQHSCSSSITLRSCVQE
jgi:hypothetical protein